MADALELRVVTRAGAIVVHKDVAKVHVSGHASAGELLYCYNIVRPTHVMPVHGETRHLIANGRIPIQALIAAVEADAALEPQGV